MRLHPILFIIPVAASLAFSCDKPDEREEVRTIFQEALPYILYDLLQSNPEVVNRSEAIMISSGAGYDGDSSTRNLLKEAISGEKAGVFHELNIQSKEYKQIISRIKKDLPVKAIPLGPGKPHPVKSNYIFLGIRKVWMSESRKQCFFLYEYVYGQGGGYGSFLFLEKKGGKWKIAKTKNGWYT